MQELPDTHTPLPYSEFATRWKEMLALAKVSFRHEWVLEEYTQHCHTMYVKRMAEMPMKSSDEALADLSLQFSHIGSAGQKINSLLISPDNFQRQVVRQKNRAKKHPTGVKLPGYSDKYYPRTTYTPEIYVQESQINPLFTKILKIKTTDGHIYDYCVGAVDSGEITHFFHAPFKNVDGLIKIERESVVAWKLSVELPVKR